MNTSHRFRNLRGNIRGVVLLKAEFGALEECLGKVRFAATVAEGLTLRMLSVC